MKSKEAESSEDSKEMLEIDLRAEQETIKNYKERIVQLNEHRNLPSLPS